jgi:succinyl-CoA synthetase beta subunit
MKVHEYQAKELLAKYGAPIPKHIVCKTADEVAAAFDVLSNGGGAMVKAQVHAGGRGAGQLKGYADKLGGVKFASSKEKAKTIAQAMLSHVLVTNQTGPDGAKINTLILQADADPAKEYYVGMVLDRAIGVPILMASAEGGMDIEEVAHKHPEKIHKVPVSPETGLLPFQAQKLAGRSSRS